MCIFVKSKQGNTHSLLLIAELCVNIKEKT